MSAKPVKITRLLAWRLTAKGTRRRDVPLTLGMPVFYLSDSFDLIDAETVTGLMLAPEPAVALTGGDFYADPAELHVSRESAQQALAERRAVDATTFRLPACPLCGCRGDAHVWNRGRQVRCLGCHHVWTPHASPALLVAHPTCWLLEDERRVMRVPIAIGMEVFVRVGKGPLVGPSYVEAITEDDVMCIDAETGVERELHAKPGDIFATGKAERAARR